MTAPAGGKMEAGQEVLRKTFNEHGFDDETIRLAEAGHSYWREHKFENDPRLHKVHLEATPTFWNMNGSAMDMFLMVAKGIRAVLPAASPDALRVREAVMELPTHILRDRGNQETIFVKRDAVLAVLVASSGVSVEVANLLRDKEARILELEEKLATHKEETP